MAKGFINALQHMNGTDEWFTPQHAVEVILPYVPKEYTIWCPFDKEISQYVQVFKRGGYNVEYGHIDDGKDFFLYEPKHYDCVISNPPYSKKDAVYERLFKLGKPFAMLVGMNGLFDSKKRFGMFRENGCQILVLNGRTKFIGRQDGKSSQAPFQTIYVCWNLLPQTIMFEEDKKGLF